MKYQSELRKIKEAVKPGRQDISAPGNQFVMVEDDRLYIGGEEISQREADAYFERAKFGTKDEPFEFGKPGEV